MAQVPLVLYRPAYRSVRLIHCSPPSWMIEIALAEKSIKASVHELSFARGEHKTPAMLALNPRGTIPVLTHGDAVLWESLAILEYLDEVFPEPPLMGTDRVTRARARNRLHESGGLKSKGMALFAYLMRTPNAERDASHLRELHRSFIDELSAWEQYYADSPWVAGDDLSLADISVYVYVATAHRLGLVLGPSLAGISAMVQRIEARPAVRETWPWQTAPTETPLALTA